MIHDRLKQRIDILVGILRIIADDPLSGNAIKDREIQLLIRCTQIQEQIIDLIDDLIDPGILLIDLVDEQDRIETGFQ